MHENDKNIFVIGKISTLVNSIANNLKGPLQIIGVLEPEIKVKHYNNIKSPSIPTQP